LAAPGVVWVARMVAWVFLLVLRVWPGWSLAAGTQVWVVSSQKGCLEVVWRVAGLPSKWALPSYVDPHELCD
jgi:hypothetical protein